MANYIEFRVYLHNKMYATVDVTDIIDAAESLRDLLTDETDPASGAIDIFTQQVTFDVHLDVLKNTIDKSEVN